MISIKLRAVLLFFLLVLTTNIVASKELKIVDKKVCFGQRSFSGRTIEAIIIHSVFNKSGGDKYSLKKY